MAIRKLKIESIEKVRDGTHMVWVDIGTEGKLRVFVYPGNVMRIFCDTPIQWLQSDLSPAQQKKILDAVSKTC
jgi:hypothetical protein